MREISPPSCRRFLRGIADAVLLLEELHRLVGENAPGDGDVRKRRLGRNLGVGDHDLADLGRNLGD
jgi:hypothetical protein